MVFVYESAMIKTMQKIKDMRENKRLVFNK